MSLRRSTAVPLLALLLWPLILAGGCDGGGAGPADTSSPAPATSSIPTGPAGPSTSDRGAIQDVGATVRRISDTSKRSGFETQIYSQLQAFSADNAFLLLDGSEGFVVRRVDDFTAVPGLDTSAWNAPRWHPLLADVIIHFDSNEDARVRLQFTDVGRLTTTTVYTFPDTYERVRVAPSWEELSRDGVWLAALLSRNDGTSVIVSLNLEELALRAELAVDDLFSTVCPPDPDWGSFEPDWVGVSPLGNYLVAQWPRDGDERCSGLEAFDLSAGAFIGRAYDGHQHGDLGVDADGETEFLMTIETSSPSDNNRPAISMRVLPGADVASRPRHLLSLDWTDVGHVSCQGPNGLCLVSWGWLSDPDAPLADEIFLLYTDGSVVSLTKHHSSKCAYWVQPRATISRDGRYAVFASDWADETGVSSCSESAELGLSDPYLIEIR